MCDVFIQPHVHVDFVYLCLQIHVLLTQVYHCIGSEIHCASSTLYLLCSMAPCARDNTGRCFVECTITCSVDETLLLVCSCPAFLSMKSNDDFNIEVAADVNNRVFGGVEIIGVNGSPPDKMLSCPIEISGGKTEFVIGTWVSVQIELIGLTVNGDAAGRHSLLGSNKVVSDMLNLHVVYVERAGDNHIITPKLEYRLAEDDTVWCYFKSPDIAKEVFVISPEMAERTRALNPDHILIDPNLKGSNRYLLLTYVLHPSSTDIPEAPRICMLEQLNERGHISSTTMENIGVFFNGSNDLSAMSVTLGSQTCVTVASKGDAAYEMLLSEYCIGAELFDNNPSWSMEHWYEAHQLYEAQYMNFSTEWSHPLQPWHSPLNESATSKSWQPQQADPWQVDNIQDLLRNLAIFTFVLEHPDRMKKMNEKGRGLFKVETRKQCLSMERDHLDRQELDMFNSFSRDIQYHRPKMITYSRNPSHHEIVQKMLALGTPEQKRRLALQLKGHVKDLMLDEFGCMVLQQLLLEACSMVNANVHCLSSKEFVQSVEQIFEEDLLAPEAMSDIISHMKHNNGNYVIMRWIELLAGKCHVKEEDMEDNSLGKLCNIACTNAIVIGTNTKGCRVLKSLLDTPNASDLARQLLEGEVFAQLVTDAYGNFVVQHILISSSTSAEDKLQVFRFVLKNLVSYSSGGDWYHFYGHNKYAVHLVVRCMTMPAPANIRHEWSELRVSLLRHAFDHHKNILKPRFQKIANNFLKDALKP